MTADSINSKEFSKTVLKFSATYHGLSFPLILEQPDIQTETVAWELKTDILRLKTPELFPATRSHGFGGTDKILENNLAMDLSRVGGEGN